jgi:hypothetical protein
MAPRGGSQLRPRNADDPTDAEFSTAAIVDHTAELAERITYSAYGEARHHWAADVDGDGAVTTADQTIIANLAGGKGIHGRGPV